MGKKTIILTIILSIIGFVMGCSQSKTPPQLRDFSIQYLDVQDNKFIVDNDVTIRIEAPEVDDLKLHMKDYGQENGEEKIEGKKSGKQWEFLYHNTHPFTKEIWLVAQYGQETIVTDKKIITNHTQPYESVFESIIPIPEDFVRKFTISKRNITLQPLGWMDENRILAQSGDALLVYHLDQNNEETLIENGWNIYPNFGMGKVIYQDDTGLKILDIASKENRQIFKPREHQIVKNLAWARNNKEVILHTVENQKEEVFKINLQNGRVNPLNSVIKEEYTIEKLMYVDHSYLFALGNIHMGLGQSGEEEITTGLLAIDIYSGKTTNLTPQLQTMEDIKILGQVNENEFLVRLSSKVMSEEELISDHNIYLLNTQSKKLKLVKKKIDYPYIYQLSYKKDSYVYLKKLEGEENVDAKVIVVGKGATKEKEILQTAPYFPKAFYLSPGEGKILFYLEDTQELYWISEKS